MEQAEFSKRLRSLREAAGISRCTLSELCGLSSDSIRRYEIGEIVPSIQSMVAIADYFGVTVDFLIGRNFTKSSKLRK